MIFSLLLLLLGKSLTFHLVSFQALIEPKQLWSLKKGDFFVVALTKDRFLVGEDNKLATCNWVGRNH
jgi:hypothetical protein